MTVWHLELPSSLQRARCFKLLEAYDEKIEEILLAEKSHASGFRSLCKKVPRRLARIADW